MKQAEDADKKVGNAEKEEIIVAHDSARVPGQHKDAAGHGDAEQLHQTVKEQETVQTAQIESGQNEEEHHDAAVREGEVFYHLP